MSTNKIEQAVGTGLVAATCVTALYIAVQFTHAAVGNPFERRRKEKIVRDLTKAINNLENIKINDEEEKEET